MTTATPAPDLADPRHRKDVDSHADVYLRSLYKGFCSCHLPGDCGLHEITATDAYGQHYQAWYMAAMNVGRGWAIEPDDAYDRYCQAAHEHAEAWALEQAFGCPDRDD